MTANAKTGDNFNRYWYANNNPYKFTDPDGRESACFSVGLGCGIRPYTAQETATINGMSEGLAGFIPGVDLYRCATSGCGAGGWSLAALAVIPGEGKLGQLGLKGVSWIGGAGKGVISFGKNANQIFHTFRHVAEEGMNVRQVATRIARDLNKAGEALETGKTVNRTLSVGGQKIEYAVHKLEDGTLRVGRVKVLDKTQ